MHQAHIHTQYAHVHTHRHSHIYTAHNLIYYTWTCPAGRQLLPFCTATSNSRFVFIPWQKAQSLVALCTVLKCNAVVHRLSINRPLLTSVNVSLTSWKNLTLLNSSRWCLFVHVFSRLGMRVRNQSTNINVSQADVTSTATVAEEHHSW